MVDCRRKEEGTEVDEDVEGPRDKVDGLAKAASQFIEDRLSIRKLITRLSLGFVESVVEAFAHYHHTSTMDSADKPSCIERIFDYVTRENEDADRSSTHTKVEYI